MGMLGGRQFLEVMSAVLRRGYPAGTMCFAKDGAQSKIYGVIRTYVRSSGNILTSVIKLDYYLMC